MTRRFQRRAFYALRGPARRVLPLAMLFGASLGTLAGSRIFPPVPESVASLADASLSGSAGYLRLLWTYSAPCFIAVFLSAVLFGFLLLPILFLFRGFLLSYSVSVLLAGGVPAGRACLIVGAPGSLFSYGFVFAWRGGVLLLSGYIPNLPRLSDRPVFVRFRRPASDRRAARVCRGIRPAAFDPVTTIKHSIVSRERKEEGRALLW